MELSIKNEKLVAHFEAERNIASQNANQQAADSFLDVCEARGVLYCSWQKE